MSSAPSTPTETKKRTAVKAELEPPSDQSPASLTTKKTTKTRAAPKYSPTKADAWTPHSRLRLFEAYQSCANVKWDEVAQKVSRNLPQLLR